ncbi:MAG TPA: N-acetylmuramoyl-L-alanine amidase [Leptolyngbyaceae cyanobacterium]
MKFYWLLPSTLSIFLLSSPAEAARLNAWHFNVKHHRLEIKTQGKVQPKAKLVFNPTRLVIDLPGTDLKRTTVRRQIGGVYRSIRVGQVDDKTTRLVIELSPGYQLDPKQVKFRGASPSYWTVQLPKPEKVTANLPSTAPAPQPPAAPASVAPSTTPVQPPVDVAITPSTAPVQPPVAPTTTASADRTPQPQPPEKSAATTSPRVLFPVVVPNNSRTLRPNPSLSPKTALNNRGENQVPASDTVQVERVLPTGDGFFIRTRGNAKLDVQVNRSEDRTNIYIDLKGATLSQRFAQPRLLRDRYGINSIQLTQAQTSPPTVRMRMQVDPNSPNWQATLSQFGDRFGGVVLLPSNLQPSVTADRRESPREQNSAPDLATIQSVELGGDGTQLQIRADQIITYASGWDRASASYSITVTNAQLANSVKGPSLDASSPVLRVRLRQTDPRTVTILVQPAAGVRVGNIGQPRPELLSLELQRSSLVLTPPPSTNPDPAPSIPVPSPAPEIQSPPEKPLNRKGRIVVMVDPGHGGKDPGAIGIKGVQEKDIILPISKRIAQLLEEKGIQAVMTRDSDYFVDLQPRVDLAERANADLFVSIHANSLPTRPDISGLETYYFDSGQRLAQVIHNSLLQNVNIRDRRVRKARFYVLRKSSMPSVLVEVGFVTGREDAPKLSTSAYQNQLAEAIVRGILQYVRQN